MMTPVFSRRFRCRTVLALLALVLAAQLQTATAGSIAWCKTDPKIDVGGRVAHIYIYSPNDIKESATGPNDVVVTVPPGYAAGAQVLYMDNGFGFGHRVTFVESSNLKANRRGIQIIASIYVPSSVNKSVKVELAGADGVTVISSSNNSQTNEVIQVGGTI